MNRVKRLAVHMLPAAAAPVEETSSGEFLCVLCFQLPIVSAFVVSVGRSYVVTFVAMCQ